MTFVVKGLLGLSVVVLGFSCRPLKNGAASSGLSSVTIGEFKAEGNMTAWKSGRLKFTKMGLDKPTVDLALKPSANGDSSNVTVPTGLYLVSIEYFEDEASTKILYKSCSDKSNTEFDLKEGNQTIEVFICGKDGKEIGATTGMSDVTVTPKARTSTNKTSTVSTSTASSTPAATAATSSTVSYTMSSKAGAELNSVEVSYTIENKTTQNLYCHYRPLILFNERIDNFGVEVSAPVLIEAGKSYSPSKPEVFTGIKVLGDGTKMPVVSELKLYGMCRSTEAEAKSMFQSSCMKESAAGCDSFVKK